MSFDNDRQDLSNSTVVSAAESLNKMKINPNFKIDLVASEPLVEAPVAIDFDSEGRIWVIEMRSFMTDTTGQDENTANGKIVILEDKDKDGVMDTRKYFLDSLVLPRALCLIENGLLVAEPPNLWFYEMENDKPTKRILVDAEYAIGGSIEHQPNGLFRSLDNWIYNAKSDKRYRRKNSEWKIEATHFRGQWGIAQDNYGRLYYNTNTENLLGDYFLPGFGENNKSQSNVSGFNEKIIGNNKVFPIHPTPGVNRGYQDGILDENLKLREFTAACSPLIYRGGLWGSEESVFSFVAEPAANLIKSNNLFFSGFTVNGIQTFKEEEFLASTDERFRPVSLYNGLDGAMYIVDMYRGILEHKAFMTPYLKKEIKRRNLTLPLNCGRIYKVYPKSDKLWPVTIPDDPYQLVKLLGHDNGKIRDLSQQKIIDNKYKQLLPLLRDSLSNSKNVHQIIHSLWALEGLGGLKYRDLIDLLDSPSWPIRMHAFGAIPSILNEMNSNIIFEGLEQKRILQDSFNAPYIAFICQEFFKYDELRATDLLITLSKMYSENEYVVDAVISSLAGREINFQNQLYIEEPDLSLGVHKRIKENLLQIKTAELSKQEEELKGKYPIGSALYAMKCESCHSKNGNGLKLVAPPLNQSEWVTENKNKLISIVLFGLKGPIVVNNHLYKSPEINGEMPGIGYDISLTDSDIAELLSFIRQSWMNNASSVSAKEVSAIREQFKGRQKSFTVKELDFLQ